MNPGEIIFLIIMAFCFGYLRGVKRGIEVAGK